MTVNHKTKVQGCWIYRDTPCKNSNALLEGRQTMPGIQVDDFLYHSMTTCMVVAVESTTELSQDVVG